jgi:hypothetical protein
LQGKSPLDAQFASRSAEICAYSGTGKRIARCIYRFQTEADAMKTATFTLSMGLATGMALATTVLALF